jgi:anthranilate phosphoribosyltransferase
MSTHPTLSIDQTFSAAALIKEIGRGKHGARSLSRADASSMYSAMLNRQVSDLELGAILLAMRIKGESVEEIAGFMDAAEDSFELLQAPPGGIMPVIIPSYNGARKMPNLTPLLAKLLSQKGVPVLIHGVVHDAGRITTAEIFDALGWARCNSVGEAEHALFTGLPAFLSIETLAPQMAGQLALRRILGVRSSTHTLVKILQPFAQPALRLTSYTHPEYLEMLSAYFAHAAPAGRGDAFLMRGTEGETVANARRGQQIDWFHQGICTTLIEKQLPVDAAPDMPQQRDAQTTADWIAQVLKGALPVPAAIARQVSLCAAVARGETPSVQ